MCSNSNATKPLSFVYLLKHVDKSTFKIGKAINIHQRIPDIGGYDAFNLDESLCASFPSENLSKRYEKTIHEVFRNSNIQPDRNKRVDGDTEYFRIECFDQVVNFLIKNSNFFKGNVGPIPPKPMISQISRTRVTLSPAEKSQRNDNRLKQQEINNIKSTKQWDLFLEWFNLHKNQIVKETPNMWNALTINFAMSESQFKTFSEEFFVSCFVLYDQKGIYYGSAYGVMGFGGIRGEPSSDIHLTPISDEGMKYVKALGQPELISKTEAINAWIIARRETASYKQA